MDENRMASQWGREEVWHHLRKFLLGVVLFFFIIIIISICHYYYHKYLSSSLFSIICHYYWYLSLISIICHHCQYLSSLFSMRCHYQCQYFVVIISTCHYYPSTCYHHYHQYMFHSEADEAQVSPAVPRFFLCWVGEGGTSEFLPPLVNLFCESCITPQMAEVLDAEINICQDGLCKKTMCQIENKTHTHSHF